jgi:adenylate kinase family enzyme
MTPDRIAVVGISASGKSTFARALGTRTRLPVLHGDQLDWMENWGERPAADLAVMHAAWLAQPRWIIEGWVDPERAERLSVADLVIDLDFSRWICIARVLGRQLRRVRRAEMPEGCIDRVEPHVIGWVFWKKERPFIDAALKAVRMKRYVRLTSPRAARKWLESLTAPA